MMLSFAWGVEIGGGFIRCLIKLPTKMQTYSTASSIKHHTKNSGKLLKIDSEKVRKSVINMIAMLNDYYRSVVCARNTDFGPAAPATRLLNVSVVEPLTDLRASHRRPVTHKTTARQPFFFTGRWNSKPRSSLALMVASRSRSASAILKARRPGTPVLPLML